jgi:Methyltransferase domain
MRESVPVNFVYYSSKLRRFCRSRLRDVRASRDKRRLLTGVYAEEEILRSEWESSLKEPTIFYERCFRYFHHCLPEELRAHRRYFAQSARGFGEDAFHVMWWLIFKELTPTNFLEIGVYRGQLISLVSLLAQMLRRNCKVYGISPFSAAGDSVSEYLAKINYYEDTLANFRQLHLPLPDLCRAYSTDEAARKIIESHEWDCIYIDGNHDYKIAKRDWELCAKHIRSGGVIVLDDSGLTSPYRPPAFASGGHPGPSQVAAEIDKGIFQEVLQVGHNRVFSRL